jgi:nuclear factor 6 (one cut domain family protein 1)
MAKCTASTPFPSNGGGELEEINTKELAQRISAELKRYSIPQAIFAQRVLCRSQGTLSDLLRNPKPWSKLKSGRETFRRMWKWLQEPEYQRMSALRLAGECTSTCIFSTRVYTITVTSTVNTIRARIICIL